MLKRLTLLCALLLTTTACSGQNDAETATVPEGLILPDGFAATVVVGELGRGRHIAVRPNGDVYVTLRPRKAAGGIAALRDTDGDHVADVIRYFGETQGTGIAWHDGFLYFSSDDDVYRVPIADDELVPSAEPELIAGGFPRQNTHEAKTFALDGKGNLFVNVGAPSNACQERQRTPGSPGVEPCPQLERHAGVWQFDDATPGQRQTEVHHFATGIRHAVAIAWNPVADGLYIVGHGRDQLDTLFPAYYDAADNARLPAEEMHRLEDGSDVGWPYTYWDHFDNVRRVAPEYGGDGEKVSDDPAYQDPIAAFPAHYAPNDLLFYTGDQFPEAYHGGAFVAFHGSWNRAPLPQEGFNVVFQPMEDGMPSGDWSIFADNFDKQPVVRSPGNAKHRPCGLAQHPDGSLYVVDSHLGRVWRISYTGE